MRRMRNAALVIAAAVAVAAPTAPAGADDQGTTHVDEVAASRSGGTLFVSGSATFVDVPGEVMTDPGDGILVDVTSGTISRPDPTSSTLEFTLNISAVSTDWPNMVYLWPIMVDGNDTGLFLMGSRIGAISTNPTFILARNEGDGFSTVANVQGSLTADAITWKVPLFRLGADGGSLLSGGGGSNPEVRTGTAGLFYCCTTADQFDNWFLEDYRVPGASVEIGIADAGTPPALVPLTGSASVSGSSFTGGLDVSGLAAGDYVVVAKACYGEGNCGIATTNVTI